MGRNPKFAVLEIDGIELNGPSEYEAVSEDVFYDIGKTDTVKDKIDLNGLGFASFFKYQMDRDLIIPGGRSKIISRRLEIGSNRLIVSGILEIT